MIYSIAKTLVHNKKLTSSILICSILLFQSLTVFVPSVYAATSPWTQTDWGGGSGQTSWSDVTKYSSGSSIDGSTTAGQLTLTKNEKLTNTGFETDLSGWNTTQAYSLNDQFTTDRSAGSVNGTSAEPTGGTRTVTDAESKLSITGGQLSFSGGKVTPSAIDPLISYPSITRVAGKTGLATVNFSSFGLSNPGFGLNETSPQSDGTGHKIGFRNTSTLRIFSGGNVIQVGSVLSTGTIYNLAIFDLPELFIL